MFELNALYDSDEDSLLGCSTGDYEIENDHPSVHAVGHSSFRFKLYLTKSGQICIIFFEQ